jgi:hypothetical protein
MTAPAGTEVGLYVDLVARVQVGHVIRTGTGRRYVIDSVRVQERGEHKGRQHLRVVVLAKDAEVPPGTTVHQIYWYSRGKRGRRG